MEADAKESVSQRTRARGRAEQAVVDAVGDSVGGRADAAQFGPECGELTTERRIPGQDRHRAAAGGGGQAG